MRRKLLPSIIAIFLISNLNSFAQGINFTASNTNGCAPLIVTFTNTSTDPNAYRYEWHFGDGSPMVTDINTTTINHTYTAGGYYNTYVNVFDNIGNYVGFSYGSNANVQVNGASINMADSACIGDQVSICLNGNNISNVSWNYGDPSSGANNTSTEFCGSHTFASNGTYTVTLNSSSSCGPATVTKTIVISASAHPHPNAWTNMNSACPGLPINFQTSGYSTYSWNFADPGSGVNNTSALQNPVHAFSTTGVFTYSLTVTNGCGFSASTTSSITILNNPPFPNQPDFRLNAQSPVCPNSYVSFNAPYGYNSYEWHFGDGSAVTTTSDAHNEHLYGATTGSYPAFVRIISPCGNDTSLYATVIVSNSAPFPNQSWFQLNSTSPACPGSSVGFEAPSGFSYVWHFGDGSPDQTSTDSHTNHYYGAAITNYNATVSITNGCGNDTLLSTVVQIQNNVGFPTNNFDLSIPSSACHGDQVNLNAPDGYSNYAWVFGDGNTATTTQNHVSHAYLTNGTYSISVTITNTCGNSTTLNGSINVNDTGSFPNWLTIETTTNTSCPNDLIEFRLNQSGYQSYAWNFGDGNTVTSTGERIQHAFLATGTYTVTCTVTNGCSNSTNVSTVMQITGSSPVNPNLSINGFQNPSCINDNVNFFVDNGLSNYSYVWNYGDGSPLESTTGGAGHHLYSAVGTYTVSALVTNGCGSTATFTTTQVISNSAIPVLRGTDGKRIWGFPGGEGDNGTANTTAGCAGDAIVFYFQGEAASNVYDFGDGSTGTAVEPFLVYGGDGSFPVTIIRHAFAANGNYLVTLTLTNSCGNSVTDTMTIHIGGGLSVEGDMTTSPPPFSTCASINFLAFGGSTYEWHFGDGSTLVTSSSNVSHTFATQGVYVVTVLVTNGCGNTATFSRSLNVDGVGGPAITLSSSTTPTCVNGNNGSATISVSNGQAPYTYSWNTPGSPTGPTATGLSAGLYYATVTDNLGCPSTFAVSINNPAPIVPNISTTTTACLGATGTATASVSSGGTAPYTYLWSTGITNPTATGLATGAYTVTITDNNGCSSSANASISENGGATVALNTVTNATCYGSNTGAININVTGGAAPYTYLWSNSSTVQDPSGLAAGNYSVTVTDNSGCHATLNATVSQPTNIIAAASVVTSPTCGNFDGSAIINASGGTGPYTYHWDAGTGGSGQTTQTATNLPAGTYTVTVTDSRGCTQDGIVDLSNSNAPNISGVITNVSCFGLSNGSIDISVSGGTSPYLYTWNVSPPQTNHQDVNTLLPGNYSVFVNDAHGCMSFRSYTITQPSLLAATVTNSGVTCGNTDGTATATPNGGNTNFTYAWSPSVGATQTITGLSAGTYSVLVTDNKGCTATGSTTIGATTLPLEICMVTVDSNSTHNIIYWEKPSVTNIDSFRVYREDATNVYTLLGSVSFDDLSEYHDYGTNPNSTTKRYKISVIDNCGGQSIKSNYHNTIYIVDNGSGQFTWNPLYTIENGANPVDNYILMRDDNNTNNWTQVVSTAGTQNTLVDPAYASYPNGRWYVETSWGISCTPTRATVNTTRSNIRHNALSVGIQNNDLSSSVLIYPNPASDNVTVELPALSQNSTIRILNSIGQIVYNENVISNGSSKTKEINTSVFAKGIYTIVIENNSSKVYKKLVIN
jgi:large repetitive protein